LSVYQRVPHLERLVVRLFGDPSLQFDGRPWPLKAPQRCYAILALLPRNRDGAAGRVSVAAAVWPELPIDEAMANLRRHLHLLQRALPAIEGIKWISSHGSRLCWNENAPIWVDMHAFSAYLAESRRVEAIELCRGPLLGTTPEAVASALKERMRNAYVDVCWEQALAARRQCDLPSAIHHIDHILTVDAGREDAVRLGMALRYESGDRSSALAFFDRFAVRLSDDLGIDPMPETLALRDAILMNRVVDTGDRSPDAQSASVAERSAGVSRTQLVPFVGRTHEFASLEAAWREARRGKGSTMFVGGEAGMGKSRLLSEFAAMVALQGGRVVTGATSNPERRPFEPLVDALRKGLAMLVESPVGQPWLSSIAELLPELRAAFHDIPPAEPLEPASARARLLEGIARTIERLAKVRPLLLVLEDLHWAKRGTIDALESLSRRIGGVPAFVVVTYRHGENLPGSQLHSLRRQLLSEGRATSLELGPLGFDDIVSLARDTPQLKRPNAIAERVYTTSEGNPLFALQLLRGLIENDETPDAAVVVTTLARAIEARVESLDAPTREILGVAATIGRSFTVEMLAGILGQPEGQIVDALGELLDRCLIRAIAGSMFTYSFAHELIAKAVYDLMPQKQRTLYHRRVAAVLSSWEGAEPLDLASIARQWELGADERRAATIYAKAAQSAVDTHAPDEGIAYARSALRFVGETRSRFEMLRLIAVAERRVLERERWEGDLRALSAAANGLGTQEQFASLVEWAHFYAHVGREKEERGAISGMLRLARKLGPSKLSEAWFAKGMLEFHLGQFEAAIKPLERAVSLAIAGGERLIEARARSYFCRILYPLGRESEAQEHYDALCRLSATDPVSTDMLQVLLHARQFVATVSHDIASAQRTGTEMLALAGRLGDRWLETVAGSLLAFASPFTATLQESRSLYRRVSEQCREIGYTRGAVVIEANRSSAEVSLGFARECLDIIAAIEPEAERVGDEWTALKMLCNRAVALTQLGEFGAAIEAGRSAHDRARSLDRQICSLADIALGSALCAAGDYDSGLALAESAVDLSRNTGSDVRLIAHLAQFAIFLDEAGRIERLREAASELVALKVRGKGKLWILHPSLVAYALARAAERSGRSAQAEAHFAQGRASLECQIRRLGEDARGALEGLPFNRALLQRKDSLKSTAGASS
jgi:DNA-binding SARP family transcriptional activator/tetratricopeptide (TPR) repeat protein